MLYTPAASADVVNDATPAESVPVPRMDAPLWNVIVSPFAGAPADEVTLALNVIA
jgi:hypothetical protein